MGSKLIIWCDAISRSSQFVCINTNMFQRIIIFSFETFSDLFVLRIDEERRTVAHYLAWLGKEDQLVDILSLLPTFLNFQDVYGETPLMYAVRSVAYNP